MTTFQIAVIVGSLRRDSINRKLATALATLAPAEISVKQLSIGDLPLYSQDGEMTPTAAVQQFKADLAAAEGILFVTPEFNRSIPGALKNAIDHGSRPYGKNSWAGKPTGIIGASPGAIATAVAQQHLRTILAHLDALTMGQPEGFVQIRDGVFDESGSVANADTRKFLQGWMDRYCTWVRKHQAD